MTFKEDFAALNTSNSEYMNLNGREDLLHNLLAVKIMTNLEHKLETLKNYSCIWLYSSLVL